MLPNCAGSLCGNVTQWKWTVRGGAVNQDPHGDGRDFAGSCEKDLLAAADADDLKAALTHSGPSWKTAPLQGGGKLQSSEDVGAPFNDASTITLTPSRTRSCRSITS